MVPMSQPHVVRVEYRDGSSRLFGPVSSRQEARKLAERVQSPQCQSVRISKWSGGPDRGTGVIADRPAPAPPVVIPPPAPEPEFTVTYDDQTDVVTIDSDIAFFGVDVGAIELHLDSLAGQWLLTEGQFTTVSPTQITFPAASSYGLLLEEVEFWDGPGQTDLLATWTGSVSVEPAAPPVLSLVYNEGTDTLELTSDQPTFAAWSPGTDELHITGTGGPGVTGTNSATLIAPDELHIFAGNAAASLSYGRITQITFEHPSGTVTATWTGDVPMVVPSAFTSPAVDTLRVVGVGFNVIDRLAMSFANGNLYASNTGDPNEASTNSGNGITITTWTDTLIEFTSPYIPTGTVNAIAFQVFNAGYDIEFEWFNTTFDPQDGFPPFNAL